ncbi:hypothetical protein KSU05_09880 [Fusobacterium nucleatum]|uniref:hypothetical protein n=1 Tax=Fusobacterium nucleatum TaxID=851 RepID=UPI0030D248FC
MYKILKLGDYFNNICFCEKKDIRKGELTDYGSSLPIEALQLGYKKFKDIPFFLEKKTDSSFDNMFFFNQRLFINEYIKKIHFLGISNSDGDMYDYLNIYSFKNKLVKKIGFPSMLSEKPLYDEKIFFNYPFFYTKKGKSFIAKPSIWYTFIEINDFIYFIDFPDNPIMHLFSITLEI